MITTYFTILSLLLVFYLFYHHILSMRWEETERRRLEAIDLRLAHILRLIDAPDVRLLMQSPDSRRALFLDFSESLREDVFDLVRARAVRASSLIFVIVFFLSYYLMRLKARILCGRNDLRFLSGLELMIFRTVR